MTPTGLLRLDIVSAEKSLFSGEAQMVFVIGEVGELGIAPGHAQLLTKLRPGTVRALLADKTEAIFYISGGILEIQPYIVSVLADTAIRAEELDEAEALAAKERAEQALANKQADLDIAKASAAIAEAAAQIQAISHLKKRAKINK